MANDARMRAWMKQFDHARRLRCTVCNAENPNHCGRCRSASYCSAECQKKDWPIHKTVCKGYKLFLVTKPDNHHRVGILLPEEHSKPRLMWVKLDSKVESEDVTYHANVMTMKTTPVVRPLLGLTDDDPQAFSVTTDHDLGGKFQLPYMLQATSRALDTQTKSNKCVANLVGMMPSSFWKGPVMLTRFYKLGNAQEDGRGEVADGFRIVMGESEQDEDMTLVDFSHAMGLLEAVPMGNLKPDVERN